MSNNYTFTVGIDNKIYYFKRRGRTGHPVRIGKDEFEAHTTHDTKKDPKEKGGGPRHWAIVTQNKKGERKFLYMKKEGFGKYRIERSSFFENTTDDEHVLDSMAKIIHDHHAKLTMPKEGETLNDRLLMPPTKKLTVIAVPSNMVAVSNQYFIPVNGINEHKCFTADMLKDADEKRATNKPARTVADTFNACLEGKCEYVLTVVKNTDDKIFNIRNMIEDRIAAQRPHKVNSWVCKVGDAPRSYFLHTMEDGEIGDGSNFKDKELLKKRLIELLKTVHLRGVTLGEAQINGQTILYKGNPQTSSYLLLVGDISHAEYHGKDGQIQRAWLTLSGVEKNSDFDTNSAGDTAGRDALVTSIETATKAAATKAAAAPTAAK